MQTFLPLADFAQTAAVLDRRRLCKQRVETLQIMQTILARRVVSRVFDHWRINRLNQTVAVQRELPINEWTLAPITSKAWRGHPAVHMWRDHEFVLFDYQRAICEQWAGLGYQDTCLAKTRFLLWRANFNEIGYNEPPPWLGDPEVHASHRSVLLHKDPDHYGQFGWSEKPGTTYVWPVS